MDDTHAYKTNVGKVIEYLGTKNKVLLLSGAGMSTAAGIPDFRSPGGLYGTSEMLLNRFTYLGKDEASNAAQKATLKRNVRDALTLEFFRDNPLAYHEMRRGLIIGLGENQWKYTIGHVFPEILNRNGKLQLLASQNIDGLDHKVLSDKHKLFNPHGLMSTLVSEPLNDPLCTSVSDPIYQKYVQLVKDNIKDIYADLTARQGKSSHLWPGPQESKPITLDMFRDGEQDLLPKNFHAARAKELSNGVFSVKPGSVLFDRTLWSTNAAGEHCDAWSQARACDLMFVMGTSLSGLSIDGLVHEAGREGTPRVVLDMTTKPLDSMGGGFIPEKDCFVQGPIDLSILDILFGMGWLEQIFDYLSDLCLGSLKTLKQFIGDNAYSAESLGRIERAIEVEVEREKQFYGDE